MLPLIKARFAGKKKPYLRGGKALQLGLLGF
jgi:hypothetical protein